MARYRSSGPNWNQLRWIVESSLSRTPAYAGRSRVQGRLTYQGEGIGHDNYVFEAGGEWLVLRLGKRYRPLRPEAATRESLLREAETLQQLAESDFPFLTPEFVCMAHDESGRPIGLIESHVDGTPLSFFDSSNHQEMRIETIAEVAAEVHQLPTDAFTHLEPAADSHSHVLKLVGAIPETLFSEYPVAATVREWILAHLPKGPSVVLHGDLLPQNLLLDFTDTGEVAVIDWEYARIGDPAHDLAIVTRGARKPLKQSGGFQQLLDAYNEVAAAPLSATAVHVHELWLHLNWLAEANQEQKAGTLGGHGPDFYRDQLTALARRICK